MLQNANFHFQGYNVCDSIGLTINLLSVKMRTL